MIDIWPVEQYLEIDNVNLIGISVSFNFLKFIIMLFFSETVKILEVIKILPGS